MFKRRTIARLMAAASLTPAPTFAQQDAPLSRIAFASCADQARPQPIWEAIQAYRPEFFIFAGDNVYGDFKTAEAGNLRHAYDAATRIEGYAKLRDTVPHIAIWDDHDYGSNDGGVEFPHKAVAKEEFLRFWKVPSDDVRRSRDGLYTAQTFGPPGRSVQVILLDLRWFRSPLRITDQRGAPGKERYLPDANPDKTMMGEVQWAWLAAELRKPANLRLVVSSTQVLAEGHGWERWGNFPLERQKLFDTIRAARASNVVFLSGDRHIGALYRETPQGLYPLHDVTSSGINQVYAAAKEPGPNRLGELLAEANFGTVDIDWAQRRLTLGLRDMKGEVRRSADLRFDELRLPG